MASLLLLINHYILITSEHSPRTGIRLAGRTLDTLSVQASGSTDGFGVPDVPNAGHWASNHVLKINFVCYTDKSLEDLDIMKWKMYTFDFKLHYILLNEC